VSALSSALVPSSVLQLGAPTNIVHVFDLSIVLPALVVAAVMLLRDRPWGYVLAAMVLVKAATIGLWVLAMIWFSARQGFVAPNAYTFFFVALTVVGAVLAWRFLDGLEPVRGRVARGVGAAGAVQG
jgi:hypothetical protein